VTGATKQIYDKATEERERERERKRDGKQSERKVAHINHNDSSPLALVQRRR